MYSEQDMKAIDGRIRRNWLALAPVLAALLAGYVYALAAGLQGLAMALGPLLFVAVCYGSLAYLGPNLRYRRFLRDMQGGLSRKITGTVVEISDVAELQDGAWVLPVRIRLDDGDARARDASMAARRLERESAEETESERIVYLNISKRERMPGPGSRVTLDCFGRHIKDVA